MSVQSNGTNLLSSILTSPSKWCKGSAYTDAAGVTITKDVYLSLAGGKCCLHGAAALGPNEIEIVEALRTAIIKLFPGRDKASKWGIVASFNDHPDTTWGEVVAVIAYAETLL